ncbi:MAG: glutamine--fructose-6-phosphate transaminase (isomerizing) [bacterium]
MCGIVGYIGKQKAAPILIDGLKQLEYRGYDSAGLVVVDERTVFVIKAVGKVANLEKELEKSQKDLQGTIGIAHTRWATHGCVSEANTHPHAACNGSLYVVHNGIIENYKELRDGLIKKKHIFTSETDTEVIAHLIEEAFRDDRTLSLEDAVWFALHQIKGTYGVVVLDPKNPDKLVVARNFSPLLIGVGESEYIIASDATAVLKYTNQVIYLNDGEIAVITADSHRIFTLENKAVHRKAQTLEWDISTAKKGGYAHFMLKEICEEPDAIRNSMRGRLLAQDGKAILGGLASIEDEFRLRSARRLHICGCGTAYLAAKVGGYMLEEYAGIPVEVEYASEFRYRKPIFEEGDIFLAVSQSGETADTIASIYEAKEKGIRTLGMVNVVGSTISRITDAGVYQHVGPEIGVAATKSFVSQMSIFALLTLFIGRKRNLSMVMGKRIAEELTVIPEHIEHVLRQKSRIKRLAQKYQKYENFFFLGRKYNYPIAVEGALKLKEISYIHAEGYCSGELKHGPIALIDKNFPTIVIAPHDSVYEKVVSNIEEIKARGGPVIAIATKGDEWIAEIADDVIYIPKTLEMLTPLVSVVPLHMLAYYMGVMRGYNVDRPRNLAKSVTVE